MVEGTVRLTGGQTNAEGRVEYCSGGVWGSVCDNTWNATDASVICNQLGFPSAGKSYNHYELFNNFMYFC